MFDLQVVYQLNSLNSFQGATPLVSSANPSSQLPSTELADEQQRRLVPLLPPLRGRERPRANEPKRLNGILCVLAYEMLLARRVARV
jgi:hypothetical protein